MEKTYSLSYVSWDRGRARTSASNAPECVSEHPFLQKFSGEHAPRPLYKGRATHAPFLTRPPSSQLAPTPLSKEGDVVCVAINNLQLVGGKIQKLKNIVKKVMCSYVLVPCFEVYHSHTSY